MATDIAQLRTAYENAKADNDRDGIVRYGEALLAKMHEQVGKIICYCCDYTDGPNTNAQA